MKSGEEPILVRPHVMLGIAVSMVMFWSGVTMAQEQHAGAGSEKTNRLAASQSPYLLQHAHNPVDWYPWGGAAFEKARKENKPVFLSIGYSTCHWCHVMAHESFEDPEVARLMNEAFVNIKVDREERPDIDSIYMAVCQILTRRGGWPLTIIMTPEKKPFFAATYIPKETRFGRTGMLELIPRIREAWESGADEILKSADQITDALEEATRHDPGEDVGEAALHDAYRQLSVGFDEVHGGFNRAPKFPTPHNFFFLLRYFKRFGEAHALEMVERTLEQMRRGGVYDHLGFGFHRYATDAEWLVPHFEKMLYDQALLALAYIETYQATGKERYAQVAREIFAYVLRDMTSPEGGFYSAEDADSEGVEGVFYLWTEEEIRGILDPKEADLFLGVFTVEEEGNFAEEGTGQKTGRNILHRKASLEEEAARREMSPAALSKRLDRARQKLFSIRERRVHPYKDDKILTDWNGLMIAALAKGALVLREPRYAAAADRAADFILKRLRKEGKLLHRFRDGRAGIDANADDYAFLVFGLLNLYETTFETGRLQAALDLNQEMIDRFWDQEGGGFYFTAHDAEALILRRKEVDDGAVPSGNSMAMLNLLRIARITGAVDFEERASRIGRIFSNTVGRYPSAYTQFLVGVDFATAPSREVVLVGRAASPDLEAMRESLSRPFLPHLVLLFKPADEEAPQIVRIAEFTALHGAVDGKATAYVCTDFRCEQPTTDPDRMLELLGVR